MEFCEKENLELVRIISDIGASGLDTNRKGLNEMLSFLEDKEDDLASVIVTDFSKLSRSMPHSLVINEFLLALIISIRNVTGGHISNIIDPKMLSTYLGRSDDMERGTPENRSRRVREGIRQAKTQGIFPGKAPLGYRKEQREGRSILIIDGEKAELVNSIFRLYSAGISISQLSLKIRDEELISLNGLELRKILSNPVYAGFINTSGGNLVKGKHFPIVSEREYYGVQDLLTKEITTRKTARLTSKRKH